MPLLLTNPFWLPGGSPRIDPTHFALTQGSAISGVAGNAFYFSGVASSNGGGFDRLDTPGSGGTTTGTPSTVLDGLLGPTLTPSTSTTGTQNGVNYAITTTNTTYLTTMGFFRPLGVTGSKAIATTAVSSGGNQVQVFLNAATLSIFITGHGTASSTLTVTLNHPYFFIVSHANNNTNCTLLDLSNGKLTQANIGTIAPPLSSPLLYIGTDNSATPTNGFVGGIGPLALTGRWFSLLQQRQIAADPWSFWYPPSVKSTIFSSLGRNTGSTVLLSGSGLSISTGKAAMTAAALLSATGLSESKGTAVMSRAASLSAKGLTTSSGKSAFNFASSLLARGLSTTRGSATTANVKNLVASGFAMTSGAAAMAQAALLAARGTSTSSGRASLGRATVLYAAGLATTFGRAVVARTYQLFGRGQSQGVGSGALTLSGITLTAGVKITSYHGRYQVASVVRSSEGLRFDVTFSYDVTTAQVTLAFVQAPGGEPALTTISMEGAGQIWHGFWKRPAQRGSVIVWTVTGNNLPVARGQLTVQ